MTEKDAAATANQDKDKDKDKTMGNANCGNSKNNTEHETQHQTSDAGPRKSSIHTHPCQKYQCCSWNRWN